MAGDPLTASAFNRLLSRRRYLYLNCYIFECSLLICSDRPTLKQLYHLDQMYKGFTNMDISELFTKDSNVKATSLLQGPHIEVG